MKSVSIKTLISLVIFIILSPLSFASPSATQSMAHILMGLNHFPSAEQKTTLAAIQANASSTAAEKTIAMAIANLEHKAKPDDVAALQKVVDSADATEAEKTLATIIMGIAHKPDAAATEKLKALAM